MTKGRRTNNRHKRKRFPTDVEFSSRGTQAGSLRSQIVIDEARRSWWDRTKEWWAEKFRDAEASVAPKRAIRRVERMIHEQSMSVGQVKQTRALGQQRRKT